MLISELIKFLENKQQEIGDVELFVEINDGRETYSTKLQPTLVYRKQWRGHPDPKKWYFV